MKPHFLLSFLTLIFFTMTSYTNHTKLKVTSSAFVNNGIIPSKYSCEGEEVSPPLQVSNIPSGAVSTALILHDPDAPMNGGFTHWVIWNLSTAGNIPENYRAGEQGHNSAKTRGYKGMCPPSGTHHYRFMAYALDTKLNLDESTDKAGLEKAMTGHIVAEGELVGLYKKTK